MVSNGNAVNGTAEPAADESAVLPVVGINFGNSYASLAVLTKEGFAECIANEDGERQIACAIAFLGEETYIGNQAKHQLVKNAQNTIVGFRNHLGKRFSEISQEGSGNSAPVIQHPSFSDTPAYKVQVLQAAPAPLPVNASHTPFTSQTATPRSEPTLTERVLSVAEVTSIFLASLLQSAEDFLGKKILGAVITVPSWFDDVQRDALLKAAQDAGLNILQLLDEAGAAAVTATSTSEDLPSDRTQLVVDLGASSLELSLLSIHEGLAHCIGTLSDPNIGGDQIDSKLVKFFAKEFTKKTKIPLAVCPATDPADKRAEAKLRLAVEHTKRTLSASPGAATCSVESLKDGYDFTGAINRMRFDMEVRSIYDIVYTKVEQLVSAAGFDLFDVDAITYVGGSASLPGLDETLAMGFPESIATPFKAGTVIGGGVGDPTTILARGCALQARLLVSLAQADVELRSAFGKASELIDVKATTKTIGVLFPQEKSQASEMGGYFFPIVLRETPLPCRRTARLKVGLAIEQRKVGCQIWEVQEGVKVEQIKSPKVASDEDEPNEEDEDFEEVKEKTITKGTLLTSLLLETKHSRQHQGKLITEVEIRVVVDQSGSLDVTLQEIGKDEENAVSSTPFS